MKKVLSVVLILLLTISMTCPVMATETQQVMPRYTYTQSIYASLSVDYPVASLPAKERSSLKEIIR